MASEQVQAVMRELSQRKASDLYDLRAKVALWDKFYNADLDGMFEEHQKRFLSAESRMGSGLFVYRNELRDIVDKRADAVPADITVSSDDIGLQEWATAFLKAPVFEGTTFAGVQDYWNLYLERTGNLVLALVPNDEGFVHVQRMRTEDMDVLYNASDIEEIYGYEFTWRVQRKDEKGNLTTSTIMYKINRDEYVKLIDGEVVWQAVHGYPFIPVIHVVAEKIDGSVLGKSCIDDLIEPQLLINACLTDIRVSNRLGAFPVLYGSIPVDSFLFAPGAYNQAEPADFVNRVDTKTDTGDLREELASHRRHLYDKGRVNPRNADDIKRLGTAPSGKALLVLNEDGIAYLKSKLQRLGEGWQEMLAKVALMVGKINSKRYVEQGHALFGVSYGKLSIENAEQQLKEMNVGSVLHQAGLITDERYLELAQLKGILPSEWHIQTLLEEAAAEKEKSQLEQEAAFAAASMARGQGNLTQPNVQQGEA